MGNPNKINFDDVICTGELDNDGSIFATATFAKATASTEYRVRVQTNDATDPLQLRFGITGNATGTDRRGRISVDDAGTSRALLLNENGGVVGIGTSAPALALDLHVGAAFAQPLTGQGVAFNPGIFSGKTTGVAGIGLRVSDGDDRRVALFLDNPNNEWGLTSRRVSGGDADFVIREAGNVRLRIKDGLIGIGTAAPAGKTHIAQTSTTAAIPVLYLDQDDLSEEFIEFDATVGAGNPVEEVAATTFTPTHYVRCSIPGVGMRYLQLGTFA